MRVCSTEIGGLQSTDGSVARGILLEYVDESAAKVKQNDQSNIDASNIEAEQHVANLGVIVKAQLAGGGKHEFTVDLLHTVLVEELSQ